MTEPAILEPSEPIGDPLPKRLAAYFSAVDGSNLKDAAACFSEDAVYYLAPEFETDPRISHVGRGAIYQMFLERGTTKDAHVVQLCVVEGTRCLVEGIVTTSSEPKDATFVASITLNSEGLIERYLTFRCDGAREPLPIEVTHRPADASRVLHEYFHALDDGRFDAAADCFSADVLYSHPPYRLLNTGITDPDRVEFRGRGALFDAFTQRGKQSFGHEIAVCIQRGPHAILEATLTGLPDDRTGTFVSSLSLDSDGLIRRYVSFYCEPSVHQR